MCLFFAKPTCLLNNGLQQAAEATTKSFHPLKVIYAGFNSIRSCSDILRDLSFTPTGATGRCQRDTVLPAVMWAREIEKGGMNHNPRTALFSGLQKWSQVSEAAGGVARFTFAELCDQNRGAADFVAIAQRFHTVFLSDIPIMSLQVCTGPQPPSLPLPPRLAPWISFENLKICAPSTAGIVQAKNCPAASLRFRIFVGGFWGASVENESAVVELTASFC